MQLETTGSSRASANAFSSQVATKPDGAPPVNLIVHRPIGDGMAPTLRGSRDVALVVPCDLYDGEGLYLLEPFNEGGPCVYRVTFAGGGQFGLSLDNPAYGGHRDLVDRATLNSWVRGRVAYCCRAEG